MQQAHRVEQTFQDIDYYDLDITSEDFVLALQRAEQRAVLKQLAHYAPFNRDYFRSVRHNSYLSNQTSLKALRSNPFSNLKQHALGVGTEQYIDYLEQSTLKQFAALSRTASRRSQDQLQVFDNQRFSFALMLSMRAQNVVALDHALLKRGLSKDKKQSLQALRDEDLSQEVLLSVPVSVPGQQDLPLYKILYDIYHRIPDKELQQCAQQNPCIYQRITNDKDPGIYKTTASKLINKKLRLEQTANLALDQIEHLQNTRPGFKYTALSYQKLFKSYPGLFEQFESDRQLFETYAFEQMLSIELRNRMALHFVDQALRLLQIKLIETFHNIHKREFADYMQIEFFAQQVLERFKVHCDIQQAERVYEILYLKYKNKVFKRKIGRITLYTCLFASIFIAPQLGLTASMAFFAELGISSALAYTQYTQAKHSLNLHEAYFFSGIAHYSAYRLAKSQYHQAVTQVYLSIAVPFGGSKLLKAIGKNIAPALKQVQKAQGPASSVIDLKYLGMGIYVLFKNALGQITLKRMGQGILNQVNKRMDSLQSLINMKMYDLFTLGLQKIPSISTEAAFIGASMSTLVFIESLGQTDFVHSSNVPDDASYLQKGQDFSQRIVNNTLDNGFGNTLDKSKSQLSSGLHQSFNDSESVRRMSLTALVDVFFAFSIFSEGGFLKKMRQAGGSIASISLLNSFVMNIVDPSKHELNRDSVAHAAKDTLFGLTFASTSSTFFNQLSQKSLSPGSSVLKKLRRKFTFFVGSSFINNQVYVLLSKQAFKSSESLHRNNKDKWWE